MPFTPQQFRDAVARDQMALLNGTAPQGVFACSDCGIPLQETVTGNRPCGDGKHLCSDCFYEEFGREIDAHPIATLRVLRGA
ncbi:hypothetical protein [Methylobacterium sp. 391_Methyba4]|uniref:hypothetical protein n=1 Tax=Methylobacterium sp. 391_Methyba4 TaxID=3038924 RepID=UPI00241D7335|nr:hypothetical protein [Methylobacterium sp. 391_Methyba4]WFS06475.1 hypothetical protein P9K36_24290 [Methylobacterium sp. 391_Methyba4]